MTIYLLNSDARNIPLADQSVQCIITSPPYYGLRDYGIPNQIGLERTPQEYVASIVTVMRECWRVLKDDGVLWLNIGDSYASGEVGRHDSVQGREIYGRRVTSKAESRQQRKLDTGIKPKDMIGIPWRCAFALQDAGWYLRSDIIWSKPNPMPESVTDRPTKAHEYIFLLTKRARYYYDAEAIAEHASMDSGFSRQRKNGKNHIRKSSSHYHSDASTGTTIDTWSDSGVRNRRSVWTVSTTPYSGAHFATFPPKLIEPMVLAGSRPGDLILDPFAGTATVGRVAIKHQRRFVGLDLNLKYIGDLAKERTSKIQVSMQFATEP